MGLCLRRSACHILLRNSCKGKKNPTTSHSHRRHERNPPPPPKVAKRRNGEKESSDVSVHSPSAAVSTAEFNTVGARSTGEPQSVKAALIPAQPSRPLHAGCRRREAAVISAGWYADVAGGRWQDPTSRAKGKGVRETCVINQHNVNQARRWRCQIGRLRDNRFRRGGRKTPSTGCSGWCAMLEETSKQSQEDDQVPESDKRRWDVCLPITPQRAAIAFYDAV